MQIFHVIPYPLLRKSLITVSVFSGVNKIDVSPKIIRKDITVRKIPMHK